MRARRLSALVLHLLRGIAIVLFLFPRWPERRRRAAVRRWSRRLLGILAVRLRCAGRPGRFPERCLVVMNHVSWLDIFLLDAVRPASFVAKQEIAGWPLVGTLVKHAGTLFIERGNPRAARRTNHKIQAALTEGRTVACFPEGTTTHGGSVGRFHGALLQPALDAHAWIVPVAVRYCDEQGRRTEAVAYVGDLSFLGSVWRILAMRRIDAELHFLPPVVPGTGSNRRTLAQQLRQVIAHALGARP